MNSNDTEMAHTQIPTSNIVPERLAAGGSVQKIPILTAKYFLPSQWNPVLALLIHFRYGPKRCSHRTKCGTEPIRYVTLHFRDRRDATSLGPLQKSRPNHRSYICVNGSPKRYGFHAGARGFR